MNTASLRAFLQRRPRVEASSEEHDAAEMGTAFGLDMSFANAMAERPPAARPEAERSRGPRWLADEPAGAE